MKKLLLPVCALLLALPFSGISQKQILEKTYDKDKKSNKGLLDAV
jgi:hypothetical protein